MKGGGQLASYTFHDTTPLGADDVDKQGPVEGFTFGDYSSVDHGLYLITRDAPTPSEQSIVESLPYVQGVLDFSMLGGQRYFGNRDVTFTLQLFDTAYTGRKELENDTKRALMPLGRQELYDTHNLGYHWLGKCKSVSVDDNAEQKSLTLTVVFDCYPFAISDTDAGDDRWNDVIFDDWVFQETRFGVSGPRSILLTNIGGAAVNPTVVVEGSITVTGDFGPVSIETGTYEDTQITLALGDNDLQLDGEGSIEFKWHKEAML